MKLKHGQIPKILTKNPKELKKMDEKVSSQSGDSD